MTLRERVLRWAIRKYLETGEGYLIIQILWGMYKARYYEDNVATRQDHLHQMIDERAYQELQSYHK